MKTLCRAGRAMLLVGLAMAMNACSGGAGGNNGIVVDNTYDFAAAGVLPGFNVRNAGRSRVRGTLTQQSGQPAVNASIALQRLANSRAIFGTITTTSGTDGTYVFGDVEPGSYQLVVGAQTRSITCTANTDTTANFSGVTPGPTDGGGGTNHDPLPPPQYKWTLIIFMNADNDLEQFGVQDINEMEELPDSSQVKIVVLMDRTTGHDATNGNWTDARRFVVKHDNDVNVMTSARTPNDAQGAPFGQAVSLGELDTGDPQTVNSFIDYCQRTYPAQHYLLDIWNHGAGWRSRTASDPGVGRGVLYDDTNNTHVSTPELTAALDVAGKLDIVAFDSSLMQMLEVAYQIRSFCGLVVGSEESPPGTGYPYDLVFRPVIDNPDITAEAWAAQIVSLYINSLGGYPATESALRTSQMATVRDAVTGLGDALAAINSQAHNEILNARNATQRYGSTSADYDGNRDLIDFIDKLDSRITDANLRAAGQAVRNALANMIVAEQHSGSSEAGSHGLGIFLPSSTDWNVLRATYRSIDFARDSRWDNWLDVFYGLN
ncbi:MAG: carboxypeptidase regulatory-like domain-containing protein [Armatimonadetes bacterium]|nr:carboxypeptidase regulatory-like domain-containing protein [Armatimonadota bacterium]